MNPNPNCENECRFRVVGSVTTCVYYEPVYDKHGNNLNPDGNSTFGQIHCHVCSRKWEYCTRRGKTEFSEVNNV